MTELAAELIACLRRVQDQFVKVLPVLQQLPAAIRDHQLEASLQELITMIEQGIPQARRGELALFPNPELQASASTPMRAIIWQQLLDLSEECAHEQEN